MLLIPYSCFKDLAPATDIKGLTCTRLHEAKQSCKFRKTGREMDLAYNAEHEDFRAQTACFPTKAIVRAFQSLMQEAAPAPEMLAWQNLLIDNGYAARTIPREYGGYGAKPDILKSRIIAEEFTRAKAPTGIAGQGISMLGANSSGSR